MWRFTYENHRLLDVVRGWVRHLHLQRDTPDPPPRAVDSERATNVLLVLLAALCFALVFA